VLVSIVNHIPNGQKRVHPSLQIVHVIIYDTYDIFFKIMMFETYLVIWVTFRGL